MERQSSADLAAAALKDLAAELQAGNSEALTKYLDVMSRFHKYSWGNCLLISRQKPGSTRVAGFHAWIALGRHVRKGEKGIAILAPIVVKRPTETNENGKALVGFKATYVFDVSQTDGAELPEFATVSGDPAESLEALKSFATSQGISVEYDAGISPALGTSYGGRIALLPDMSPAGEFATLAHEIAHEMLHRDERRKETNKTIRETEAESVAYVVCRAIGLETSTAAADYIKLYNGDPAVLSASLNFIQKTSGRIIEALMTPAAETSLAA